MESIYQRMLETSPIPMWIYALDTLAFLEVNQAAVQNYGYSREEFLSMTIREIWLSGRCSAAPRGN